MHVEHEIADGPRLSLAFRARRALLLLGAALGFAAAGATASVGAHRGATQAYLAAAPDSCEFWLPNDCPDGWLEWPAEKSPYDSPPTAVTPARVRLYASGRS